VNRDPFEISEAEDAAIAELIARLSADDAALDAELVAYFEADPFGPEYWAALEAGTDFVPGTD
jgi:hypothetical protein